MKSEAEIADLCRSFIKARPSAAVRHLGPTLEKATDAWLPRLNGEFVRNPDDPAMGYETRQDAVAAARRWRESCRRWLAERDLPEIAGHLRKGCGCE